MRRKFDKNVLTKDFLIKEYVVNKKSMVDIAKEINSAESTVWHHAKKHNIPLRDGSLSRIGNRGLKGKYHPNFKGKIFHSGYVYIYSPDHPNKDSQQYVAEHRLVVENTLGRYLEYFEIVHHINGIRTDNRPENLAVVNKNNHERYTLLKLAQKQIIELEKIIEELKCK